LEAYERAIALAPRSVELHYNVASTERALGNSARAVAAYERALALAPDLAEARNNLGLTLLEMGRTAAATSELAAARALAPSSAAIHVNLGNALLEAERTTDAVASYGRAIEIDPGCTPARFNLHAVLFDQGDLAGAARELEHILTRAPNHHLARFFLAVVAREQGNVGRAQSLLAELERAVDGPAHLLESFAYAEHVRSSCTRLFARAPCTLGYAIDQAQVDGLVLELGVRFGKSLRFIAARCAGLVHGFDSFQGLPETWGPLPAGSYSTHDKVPAMPANVRLHVGWFHETLPTFVADSAGPIRLANIDCDLGSSTAIALEHLGGHVVAGSVLVFDEYFANPGWRDGEFSAFQAEATRRGWRYEYLAMSLFSKQAAVRITAVG